MDSNRSLFYTTSPGKQLLTAYTIVSTIVKLPLWIVYYLPSSNRPNTKWTYKQTVLMCILKSVLNLTSVTETKTPMNLEPGPEKDQWTQVSPAKNSYYGGIAVSDSQILPTKIGGTWYPKKPLMNDTGLVVLHFHGGAFVVGDGRKKDTEYLASTILKHIDVAYVFCAQYRLASNPLGRFPAALQDAITSYAYLVETMSIDPSRIIISGDSAGGNLTMCLLRYMSESSANFPLAAPKCAFLWSPWIDPMAHFDDPMAINHSPRRHTDYLSVSFSSWGAETYAPGPDTGTPRNTPYIGSIRKPFKVGCPIWVSGGTSEMIYPVIVKFYELFRKVPGNKIEFSSEDEAPHDTILVGKIIGFEKQAENAAKKAAKFLKML